jgi:Flp pilus assembly protein TadD
MIASWRAVLLTCLVLIVAVALTYREAPQNGFHFDDRPHILNNASVRNASLELDSLKRVVDEAPLQKRKLAYLTLAVDWWRGGGSPVAFQVTNIVIHMLTTLAVLLLLILVLTAGGQPLTRGSLISAAAGAALWALHPIQVQAVTYVIQRMASLAALFTVSSVATYILARRSTRVASRWIYFLLSALAALCAAFSKENAWILPLLLAGAELAVVRHGVVLFRSRLERLLVLTAFWSAVLAFLVSCLGIGPIANRFEPGYVIRDFTMAERLMTQPRVILFHISQLLAPITDRFSIEHDFEVSTSLFSPAATLPAILLLGAWCALGIWLLQDRQRRNLSFFVLWVPATLAIESSFVGLEMVFEHRMYLPTVGLFGAVAWLLQSQLRSNRRRRVVLATLTLAAVATLGSLSFARIPVYQTQRSLLQHATQVAPNSGRAWSGYGLTLLRDGERDQARSALERALDLDPRDALAPEFLGVLLMDEGRLDEAQGLLATAAANGNNSASLRNHIGELYLTRGEFSLAVDSFAAAAGKLPWVPAYHFNLALALERQGQCAAALDSWQRYLELEPNAYDRQQVEEHLAENYSSGQGDCSVPKP